MLHIQIIHSLTLFFYVCQDVGVPIEVHFVNFRVLVLNLGVDMADEDGEVGQATLHREHFGKAANVFANAVDQTPHI